MGTNYYAHNNPCNHCGRHDQLHIGKSMHTLRLHPNLGINDMSDWRRVLDRPDIEVFDEYDRLVAPGGSDSLDRWLDQWRRYDSVDDYQEWKRNTGTPPGSLTSILEDPSRLTPEGYHSLTTEFC